MYALRKSKYIDDWFVIEPRISDADVEGTAEEMRAIVAAIQERGAAYFKRCAVLVRGGNAIFWSPRNSRRRGVVPLDVAYALAANILEEIEK